MLLAGPSRPGVGFRAEVLTLGDSATGMVGRAVWTDENGDNVYSEIRGEGTATGTYELRWQYVLEAEDGTVQGRAVDLAGRVRLVKPPVTPAGEGVKP